MTYVLKKGFLCVKVLSEATREQTNKTEIVFYFWAGEGGCSENEDCGVRSAECGVRSAECGVRSLKKKGIKKFKKIKNIEIKAEFKSELSRIIKYINKLELET